MSIKKKLKFSLRHPFIIPILAIFLTMFTSVGIFISAGGRSVGAEDSHVVRLYMDGGQRVVPTRAQSVGQLIDGLGISLRPEDVVEPAREAEIDADNFAVNIYRARPVTVVDGANAVSLLSAQRAPRAVADSAGIKTYPEDSVELAVALPSDERILGDKIVIDRATPVVISLYGTTIEARTRATTVNDLLIEKNIKPIEGDTILPSGSTKLTPSIAIFVVRMGQEIRTEEVAIDSPVEFEDDHNLTLGTTRVIDPGTPGRKLVTYEITLTNGKETSRRSLQEVIVAVPTVKKVAKGRKAPVVAGNKAEIMAAAGIDPSEYYAVDYIISRESGWRVNATNAGGCAGLGQACPGSKLANVCPNWQSDPVCQMVFFSGYARGRYGSWSNAYDRWQVQHWW